MTCGDPFPSTSHPVRRYCSVCQRNRRVARTLRRNEIVRAAYKHVGLNQHGLPYVFTAVMTRAEPLEPAELERRRKKATALIRAALIADKARGE